MADEIEFTMPGDNSAEPVATEPVVDIATGEPTLAVEDGSTSQDTHAEGTPAVATKPTPDADAALAVAAKSSREAREFKRQLEAANAELAKLKEAPPVTDDYKAKYEAIKKNPALLYKEGWEGDKLMHALLDPDGAQVAVPLDKDALKREILAEIEAARAETPEQAKARTDKEAADREQGIVNATEFTKNIIKTESESNYWVDEADARALVMKVEEYCVKKGFTPTREQATDLLKQGITKLHASREKRFAARGIGRGTQSQNPSQLNTELSFTEQGSGKLRVVPESAKPTPKVPGNTGNPLPTKKPGFEIGFT